MKIFQTSSLFETNKFHHGGPPFSGGPGAIAPVAPPLIRPWVGGDRNLFVRKGGASQKKIGKHWATTTTFMTVNILTS